MSLQTLLDSLPEGQRKHLDPASPGPMRMMAAKGMAPLPPREMVIVLTGLSLDADEKVAAAAAGTLAGLPEKILGSALDAKLPPAALGGLAQVLAQVQAPSEAVLEKLVLNRETPDDAIAVLAPTVPTGVAEIIASNQERCMRSEVLVEGIRHNPNLLKSSLDRLFDFLVRAGVIYDDMPEFGDAMARLSPTEMQEAAEKIEIPPALSHLIADDAVTDEDLERLTEALEADGEEGDEVRKRIPVLKLINGLNIAQKIALGSKGNKEARAILIRDRNRLVATAAVNNPRVTDPEVIAAAQSRSVADDVIRIIARSKDMTRSYAVKKALVQNPKTPLPTTMHLLTLLRANDLREVAKSKNVPSAVSNQAKRLVERKK
jgi:hypothetical protein